uniref:ATP synthase CF1 epsilon subunit n=1 Tax=Mallomonas splendens TaxID=52552 RepID=A0A3G2QZK7_9STRA|nr:ATP synthase CF1 epsilon subunit [Mallomonas splendens]AYO28493.1 ATP synthase CF1 epsilon subunit [Mallomonas splendens]
MQFFLASPDYNQTHFNLTKIRVHLSNGVAEIYEQHQDLLGKIINNVVDIETTLENKLEKVKYLVQDGVFVVSSKISILSNIEKSETSVYIYAKRIKELNPKNSVDEIAKEYQIKKDLLDKEELKTEPIGILSNSKIYVLRQEVEFLEKAVSLLKSMKA